jgi:DNA-binding transcriptional LysR family regulator
MKLPPLKTLPVFEAVARLNSFTRAAEELHVSQSAVSHRIRQLEGYLGETLFHRGGRNLSLTEEGLQYYEAVSTALAQIERASEQLQGNEDTRLRLAVYSSFAVTWLIPRLPHLQRRHPQLDLMLEMMSEMPHLSDRVADCFIAINARQRGFSTEPVYAECLFAICSRQFWRQVCEALIQDGLIDDTEPARIDPAWLGRFPLLSATSIFERKGEDWRRWYDAVDQRPPEGGRMQHFSHMLLAHEACRHHQGIALANDYMFDEAADPDLVRLPCHSISTGDVFHFACKTSRRNEPAIRLLRQWVRQQAISSGLRKA